MTTDITPTSLPAIETILDALPGEARVRVVLEVADEHEERTLSTAAQLDITWLHRDAHSAQADTPLEESLRTMQLSAAAIDR